MPGTIQVSVLDINGPSSSSPPSSIFLKLSMGKREYQTEENGDFSFPLTSLRDNLIIILQDVNGNQISHTGVGTMSIIEKGLWDDLFPLEGGGHVHMKLQFILSKEERNRIRMMRESALKKKRGASTIGRSQSLSSINNEVSDSQSIVVHNVVANTGDLAVQLRDKEKEGTTRAQPIPNATDRSEETPSTTLVKKIDTHFPSSPVSLQKSSSTFVLSEPVFLSEEKPFSPKQKNDPLNKPKKQSSLENVSSNGNKLQEIEVHHNVQARPTLQKEDSPVLGSSKSVVAAKSKLVFLKMESSPSNKPKKRESLETPHSSVKKMVNAFESGQSQDTRPIIKPPAGKSQPNKDAIKVRSKDQDVKDSTFPSRSSSEILKNPFPLEDLPQTPLKIMKTGDHIGFDKDLNCTIQSQPTTQSKESRTVYTESKGTGEVIENNLKEAREEMKTEERAKSPAELSRPSAIETATLFKRTNDQDFAESSVTEERGNERYSNDSHQIITQGAGNDNLESISSFENGGNSYEYCGTLLFANDTRRLCLTTGGKELMDLLGGLCIEGKSTHEGKELFSIPEDEGKHRVQCETEAEVKRSEKKAWIFKKSKSESSGDDSSSGPIGQAIKIAIIVGFGILVLLARQSEPRKSKRKGNDNFFTTPYRMDRESLADEEW